MTRLFFAVLLLSGAALTASSVIAAGGGERSGEIVIRGTVDAVCEIAVVDLDARLNLNEDRDGLKVGSVTETCNHPEGYVVSLKSANGGFMSGPLEARSDYRIHYDSLQGASLSRVHGLRRDQPSWNASHDLHIRIDTDDALPAGFYSDRVLIEIAAP